MVDEYIPSDKFNLNLSTLQSLHTTLERINDCTISIISGRDLGGRIINKGEVLNIKLGLLTPLFMWANVLIDKEKEFNDLFERKEKIQLNPRIEYAPGGSMINKTKPIIIYDYSYEIDKEINKLIFDICRCLQKTNIFKAKKEDAREAIIQL